MVWFLPFESFNPLVRHPIGMEYSLIGMAVFLINKLSDKGSVFNIRNNLLLLLIVIIFIISVWVSDLAIITICVLLFVLLLYQIIEKRISRLSIIGISYFLIGAAGCYFTINYLKSFAVVKAEHYLAVNDLSSIRSAFQIIISNLAGILSFKRAEVFISIYTYMVLVFFISFLIFLLRKRIFLRLFSDKWFSFFVVDFIVVFIAIILSSWVLINGMGGWYFIASYISLSVAVILSVEKAGINKIFRYALFTIAIIGAISQFYTMKYVSPKRLRPMSDVVGEFRQLGRIGIIGDFWNSYIISCTDPEMIKATPNDRGTARNEQLTDEVFEQKNIYIIRDMWLDLFPDTLEQYGYFLQKHGSQFNMGDCYVCKYKKIKFLKKLYPSALVLKNFSKSYDGSLQRDMLFVSGKCDTCAGKYVVGGPFIPLGIGSYTARFYLKTINIQNQNPIALLDVSAEWGNYILASKKITTEDTADSNYKYFDLDFTCTRRYTNVECRIIYYGNADLYFDHIEIMEK
jgi:hypothetical protein